MNREVKDDHHHAALAAKRQSLLAHLAWANTDQSRGRAYRAAVVTILRAACVEPLPGPLAIHVELYPPDGRKRDVDNTLKAVNDSLQHGGAFHDDSQIVWLLVEKAEIVPGGNVIVRIAERTCKPLPFPTPGPLNLN